MKNETWQEALLGVALIILSLLCLNPWDIFMPTKLEMGLAAGAIVVFVAYVVFIWRERPSDEREQFHRLLLARYAFIAGGAVLLAGIVVQSLRNAVDPWLVASLSIMVAVKIAGAVYVRNKH